ncbi:hypothetical protein C3L33_12063, partial [Rhododendron williamsianum]
MAVSIKKPTRRLIAAFPNSNNLVRKGANRKGGMSCANLVRRPHTPLLSRTTIPGRTTITHFYDLYVSILGRCIESKSLKEAKTVHQHLLKNSNNNPIVLDKLTRLYISFNELEVARRVFDEIPNPERKNNVILWNQLIRAYAWKGPFGRGRWQVVHDQARRNGLVSDVYISTALVDFYAKCGCLVEARKVFDIMPERDVVAWNAMVAGSSLHGLYGDAMRLVVQMQEEGLCPNPSTVVAVLPAIGEVNGLSAGKAVQVIV